MSSVCITSFRQEEQRIRRSIQRDAHANGRPPLLSAVILNVGLSDFLHSTTNNIMQVFRSAGVIAARRLHCRSFPTGLPANLVRQQKLVRDFYSLSLVPMCRRWPLLAHAPFPSSFCCFSLCVVLIFHFRECCDEYCAH